MPWQNIIIDGDENENTLEGAYLEEICDFWDSLNYYIDLSPEPTDDPPTQTTTATTKNSVMFTTANIQDTVSTTSGSGHAFLNAYLTLYLCMVFVKLFRF